MAYRLSKLKAPRLTGLALHFMAALTESRFPGGIIIKSLLESSGIPTLKSKVLNEEPVFYPLHPAHIQVKSRKRKPDGKIKPENMERGFRHYSIRDFEKAYRTGRSNPVKVAENLLKIVAPDSGRDPINAIIKIDPEDLYRQAEISAERIRTGKQRSLLEGVPVAVKDEIDALPYSTSVGTSFLGKEPATADAAVVERLREAGALIIGKANMHEIGIGVTGNNPYWRAVKNPYNTGHYTGGSSSGSAAAVAAGYCPAAIGADGGGSIRIPSSLCGVTGIKPTFGRVSERGAAPLCWSVAHIGPIASNVEDAAAVYSIIAGKDAFESLTHHQPDPEISGLSGERLEGKKIGIYTPWVFDCSPDIHPVLDNTLKILKDLGADIVEVEIPELEEMRVAHLITIVSEMTTAMETYDRIHRKHHSDDVRINLAMGRALSNVDYINAQKMRARAIDIFRVAFEEADIILTPSTAVTAPGIQKDAFSRGESDLGLLSNLMRYATPANLTGLPAVTVPAGYDSGGMPVGIQLMGRPWYETDLLETAASIEPFLETRKPVYYHSPLDEN